MRQVEAVARGADNRPETFGQLGPCMRALPNDRWREFVRHLVTGKPGHGAVTRAFRAAGLGGRSSRLNQARDAYKLSHDERIIAAVTEESRKVLRVAHPEAVKALLDMVRSPDHKDHARAVESVLARTDPVVARTDLNVTHRIFDADEEEIEELRAARALGATREKLLELFGGNRLPRLERLDIERRADKARTIEGSVIDAETIEAAPSESLENFEAPRANGVARSHDGAAKATPRRKAIHAEAIARTGDEPDPEMLAVDDF